MADNYMIKDLLKEKAEMFHVKLDETALERFEIYARLLVEWNEKINLTAITDPEGITIKHFLDSLTIFAYVDIPKGSKVIDVGTGAGFPGLAMLIARPDLDMTLMDSTKKRLAVIENILENIGLQANVVHSRAEDAGQNKAFREQYDYSTARAVTNLRDLAEYCLPFVKVGGSFVPMKSAKTEEEIAEGKKAIHVLGGQIVKVDSFELIDCGERTIINVKKISPTPAKYPRPSAKIAKNPIK
jgi:16S rRNA (guanine527-N7)-methyltransferase